MGKSPAPLRGNRFSRALFWVCNIAIGYTWALYPALLKLLSQGGTPKAANTGNCLPSVSVVLVVHNEEAVIGAALEDLLALEYPHDQIEYVVVSDGSTDSTDDQVRSYTDPRVRLIPMPRVGHTAGVVQGVAVARNEIIVRTDADTRHRGDYLLRLMRHYEWPCVGCVGARFSFANVDDTGITRNEGLYWKFEMLLRQMESDLGILSTTSGAVMSFRRELFAPFSPAFSEDVVIPKLVVKRGYRVVQEPNAIAYEVMPRSIHGEFRARRRMVSRGVTGLLSREAVLSPVDHPGHWVSIVSHKLLRWCTPIFMIGSFTGALALSRRRLYRLAVVAHLALYGSAMIGYCLERQQRHIRLFSATFSFCLANAGFLMGLVEALRGRRISAYKSQE